MNKGEAKPRFPMDETILIGFDKLQNIATIELYTMSKIANDFGTYILGVTDLLENNTTLGITDIISDKDEQYVDNLAYTQGRFTGDAIGIGLSIVEIEGGLAVDGFGIVLSPVSGGVSLAATIPETAVAAHGSTVFTLSSYGMITNISKKYRIAKGTGGSRPNNTGETVYKTTKEATKTAKKLGFNKVNGTSYCQVICKNGKIYITSDIDSHIGGA